MQMKSIREIYREYVQQECLPVDWKQQLYSILKRYQPDDIKTIEEHIMFLKTLGKLRTYIAEDTKLNGKNFSDRIASLLAVGNDGLYSNDLRFIFELIQNVDDCEYSDVEDCHLDIKFEYDLAPGKIIFTYNERGFSPFNVFSVTGIAEESKNISADKIEIGEKGIGFKSVFGVAKKIYIESGMFSFELHKDNYTVPIPKYDGYEPISGTRLTIFLDDNHNAKIIHQDLLRQYAQKDAILNKNPILFLNKLTHLKMYYDGWRYVEFDVEKRKQASDSEILFEDEVIISVDMHSAFNGSENKHSSIVPCKRYTMPITYGKEECQARYGNNIKFSERKHNIIAIFPKLDDEFQNYSGILYSFLPTQIKIAGPLVLHVPYKLDGSRQFVDDQGNNKWFEYTNEKLSYFLKSIYVHLASVVKQEIVKYLPQNGTYFFKHDNDKVRCLQIPELKADAVYHEKIFMCTEGTFETCEDVVSFGKGDLFENAQRIYELLAVEKKLFLPYSSNVDMRCYRVSVMPKVMEKLFERGLQDEELFAEIANILEKTEQHVPYLDIISEKKRIELTQRQVSVIASHKKIAKSFVDLSNKYIEQGKKPNIVFIGEWNSIPKKYSETIVDLVEDADLNSLFEKYIEAIEYKFMSLPEEKGDFYLAGNNGIVLESNEPLGAFSKLSAYFDPHKTFSATLRIRQASEKLNNVDESMSNEEYLSLLRGVRSSLIGILSKKAYSSYISIVNNAASNKDRFLYELLQNADDCRYFEGVDPEFILSIDGHKLEVSYNEIGFTKDNVRAITAIGESTKKMLLNGEDRAIGEKGIGFKSVFGVANSVEIHSNGFDFLLTSEHPTVPEKCIVRKNVTGTLMFYELKDMSVKATFTEERILQACLCLRNIKKVNIDGIKVSIEDLESKRIIAIRGKTYSFERFVWDFDINDDEVLAERSANQKSISKHQRVVCYIPPTNFKYKELYLYAGLPVEKIECRIPLVIDAPFELTTARDDVLDCKWNEYVKNAIYAAIIHLMEVKKRELRLDILKYVGYQNQNNTHSFGVFGKKYLNSFDWLSQLKGMTIIPCIDSEEFVRAGADKRILPEIILKIWSKNPRITKIKGTLIDTRKSSKYISLLELLECKKSDIHEELEYFEDNLDLYLSNPNLREEFYAYLVSKRNEIEQKGLQSMVRKLKIYPSRISTGYEFISYNENFYTHVSQVSDKDFTILETNIMSYELCQGILGSGCRINQLTQAVYDAQYRNNIENMVSNCSSNERVAEFLLREFKTNLDKFKLCRNSLMGMISEVPMKMASGNFNSGNKFINKQGLFLQGPMLKDMYVSEKYQELAEFLGCTDVIQIHYSDIDVEMDSISDADIEDIQNEFSNYVDILSGLVRDKILTDEQIERYNLQYLNRFSNVNADCEEDFPGKRVADIARLRHHIRDEFQNSPNPYVRKKRLVSEPKNFVDKEAYTTSMYESQYNDRKCFCQMCGKLFGKNYIERNDVQKLPRYGWRQMYLSLCLTCSKDFIMLRNNETVWKHFIDNMISANVEDVNIVVVEIGDRKLSFTATHLAEIQEIMKLEQADNRVFESEVIEEIDEFEETENTEPVIIEKNEQSQLCIFDL